MTWDILGIGCAAVDDLVYLDHFPAPDSKTRAQAMQRQGGGLTATALVAAARLGASAAFVARLGDNELSRYTIRELEREGVDCSQVALDEPARPYHAIIVVDLSTGSRTILYTGEGVVPPRPEDMTRELVSRCQMLVVDPHAQDAAIAALAQAHACGIPVVADVEDEASPAAQALLGSADHLIIGIELAARLTGLQNPAAMVRALARPAQACCAVTAGAQGCWYTGAGDGALVHHLPAFHVDVVDTTGCGDVFHGAYAAAIARGAGPRAAIRVATAAAGLKATRPGGRAGIPDWPALQRFLAEHEDDDCVDPA